MPAIKPVSYESLVKVFEQNGFTFDRQRGDLRIYTKPDIKRPVVIPMYFRCSRVHHQEPAAHRRDDPGTVF
jgi:predicted RNA binding protein YcfA (HicA-like mRNA interferase family)